MTVSLEILISDEDMNRLYAIKKKLGKDDLTPSEFALDILDRIAENAPSKGRVY